MTYPRSGVPPIRIAVTYPGSGVTPERIRVTPEEIEAMPAPGRRALEQAGTVPEAAAIALLGSMESVA